MTPWGLWVLGLDTEALSVGQASLAGCLEIWEGHPVYSVYSWFFFSFLSPSNLQQKLGTRKKDSIVELGRNLRVFWFWVRSLPWVLGGPSQTQCLTDCRAVLHPKEADRRALASGRVLTELCESSSIYQKPGLLFGRALGDTRYKMQP